MEEALYGLSVSGSSSTMEAVGFTYYLLTVVDVPLEHYVQIIS